jgi:hypothetical protein
VTKVSLDKRDDNIDFFPLYNINSSEEVIMKETLEEYFYLFQKRGNERDTDLSR